MSDEVEPKGGSAGLSHAGLGTQAYSAVRWTTASMATRALTQLAQVLVLARLLDARDFGLMAIVMSIVVLATLVTGMGLSQAIIQDKTLDERQLSSLYWVNVLVGAAMTGVTFLLAGTVAWVYAEPRLESLVQWTSLVFLLGALGTQLQVRAERDLRFRGLALVEILSSLGSLAVALVAAAAGLGVYALVAGVVVFTGLRTVGSWVVLSEGWRPQWVLDVRGIREPLSFGLYIVGGVLVGAAGSELDVTLGGWWIGAAALGLYSLPRDLSNRVVGLVNPIVTRVGLPVMARVQEDPTRVRQVYLKAVAMIAAVNAPVYACIALFAGDVVAIALGPGWEASVPVLRILAVRGILRAVVNPNSSVATAVGRADLVWSWTVGQVSGMVVGLSVAAQWGSVGLAWGMLVVTLFTFVVQVWWMVTPLIGVTSLDIARSLLPVLAATCAAVAMAALCTAGLAPGAARLGVGVAVGAVAYLAVSVRVNRPLIASLRRLASRA